MFAVSHRPNTTDMGIQLLQTSDFGKFILRRNGRHPDASTVATTNIINSLFIILYPRRRNRNRAACR